MSRQKPESLDPVVYGNGNLLKTINWQMSGKAPVAATNYYTDIIKYMTNIQSVSAFAPELLESLSPELVKGITIDPELPMEKQKPLIRHIPAVNAAIINLTKLNPVRFSNPGETMELMEKFYADTGLLCSYVIHEPDHAPNQKETLLAFIPFEDKGKATKMNDIQKRDDKYLFFAWAENENLISKQVLDESGALLGVGEAKFEQAKVWLEKKFVPAA